MRRRHYLFPAWSGPALPIRNCLTGLAVAPSAAITLRGLSRQRTLHESVEDYRPVLRADGRPPRQLADLSRARVPLTAGALAPPHRVRAASDRRQPRQGAWRRQQR